MWLFWLLLETSLPGIRSVGGFYTLGGLWAAGNAGGLGGSRLSLAGRRLLATADDCWREPLL